MQRPFVVLLSLALLSGCSGTVQTASERLPQATATGPGSAKPTLLFRQCKELPEYPRVAAQNNWTGTTVLTFWVDENGNATRGQITQSSGHDILDKLALTTLSKCPFSPARKDGVAFGAEGTITYVWKVR